MFRSRPVSLLLVGLFVWVTGCSTYAQIEPSEVGDHGKVRVTTADGERQTIRNPRVETDSVKGLDRSAIALDQVAELESVGTNVVGTVFTVLGLGVLLVAVGTAIYCAGNDDTGYSCP